MGGVLVGFAATGGALMFYKCGVAVATLEREVRGIIEADEGAGA